MYHYKDCHPIRTINRIRSILESLELMPIEGKWENNEDRSYSVRLVIDRTEIGTNGKGITAELALASAFGEFMERLQNQFAYPVLTYYKYDESLRNMYGFTCAPDEKYLSIPELVEKIDKNILQSLIPVDLDENEPPDKYLRAFSMITLRPDGKVLCIPYYCINTDSLVYLPYSLICFAYGTNGMCAGNTPEEALVQGICEIIERYVNKRIILDDITPPEIPREHFSTSDQNNLIDLLEKSRKLKVIVKDTSLEEQLPAVGVAVINKDLNKYLVKVASHVEMRIALERTLTELFQGRTVERLEKGEFMVPFEHVLDESYKKDKNVLEIIRTGEGPYNNNFFGNSGSYPPDKEYYGKKNLKSNKEYLRYLVQHLLKKDWYILVRDVSFLGFPAFHIIISGKAEVRRIRKKYCINAKMRFEIQEFLRNLNSCTEEELLKIADFIENQNEYDNIADITFVPYMEGFPWKKIDFDLFLCALYLRVSDFQKSHVHMKDYLSKVEEKNISLEQEGLRYYKCVRDYLAIVTEQKEITEENVKVLQHIYGEEVVSNVIETISPEKAFQHYGKFECPNCSKCAFEQFCYYKKIREIHKKIKASIAHNVIDQLNKNRAFWSEFV